MRGLFVTGTDTDIGKTVTSALLLRAFAKEKGLLYFKPVQSGAKTDSDTETVRALAGDVAQCAPPVYSLQEPMSPDRAAAIDGIHIELGPILRAADEMKENFVVAEGAGGCLVPINSEHTILDLIQGMGLPPLVVASTRLGTINHTLLTWKMLEMKGLQPAGLFLVGPKDPGLKELFQERLGKATTVIEIPQLDVVSSQTLEAVLESNHDLQAFCRKCVQGPSVSKTVTQIDAEKVWHPFTQHGAVGVPPEIVSGAGPYVRTAEGHDLIDGISSWWVNLHGHGNPVIAERISQQAHQLEHVIFAGFTHAPGVQLIDRLTSAAQERGCDVQRGFYSDNGSTAVEVALKMAYQFHQNRQDMRRRRFLALEGSYHGDTIGAMSVAGKSEFHAPFQPLMFPVDTVEPDDFEALEKAFEDHGHEYAAMIVEPMVQGAGGMRFYSSAFLDKVAELARAKGVLVIADEIFTGFYRMGKLFAFEHSRLKPDLICLSKGITGGFLPLSVTLATESIFEAFRSKDVRRAFLHGHSYTGNPIACAAGLASWDLLMSENTQNRIQDIGVQSRKWLERLADDGHIENHRQLGTLGAFDVKSGGGYFSGTFSKDFHEESKKQGALLRPLGPTVYTLPPYCTTPDQLNQLQSIVENVLQKLRSSL